MSPSTASFHVDRRHGDTQQTPPPDRSAPPATSTFKLCRRRRRRRLRRRVGGGRGRPFLLLPPPAKKLLALLVLGLVFVFVFGLGGRHVHCLLQLQVNGSRAHWRAGHSELAFEYLHLDEVPSDQMCAGPASPTPLNSLSFAFNRIKSIESNAFACVASNLRILNLRRNQIELISASAFEHLEHLQVLLLDGNRIKQIPGGTFLPLAALRHLNLANNQIESIGSSSSVGANYSLDFSLNFRHPNELISLDLRSNPLARLQSACLGRLTRLKTLVLSQTSLLAAAAAAAAAAPNGRQVDGDASQAAEYRPLAGLAELRFLHLDELAEAAGAQTAMGRLLPIDLCRDSPRLASLTLRNNQLTRIPKFSNCQSLLQIDLSHNQLAGSLNNQSFVGQRDLLDLYLGFNRLEYIDSEAFQGLERLQLLELHNNHLAGIHPAAFRPFGASLVELNVAFNGRLAELPVGAQLAGRLRSLRANGNHRLRELSFRLGPQVEFLALTYAYHCCDYLQTSEAEWSSPSGVASSSAPSVKSAIVRLLGSFLRKLLSPEHERPEDDSINHRHNYNDRVDARNVTESILILKEQQNDLNNLNHNNNNNNNMLFLESNRMAPEVEPHGRRRRHRQTRDLIDDYSLRAVRRIRRAHLAAAHHQVGAPDYFTTLITSEADERPSLFRRQAVQQDDDDHDDDDDDDDDDQNDQDTGHKTTGKRKRRPICLPRPNSLQPCRDLFDSWWLRLSIWSVFVFSFAGNILVIVVLGSVRSSSSHSALTSIMWLQGHSKRHIDVPRFLVLNLAVADLLMSLYLGLLAFVDLSSLGQFRQVAVRWQHSAGCQVAGFLAVLSSELSVFILAIITLERNYAITNAVHLNRRLSLQKAMFIMLLGYLFALAMAVMPLNGISDYRKFSICLPLDLGHSSADGHHQPTTKQITTTTTTTTSSQLYLITLVSINSFSFILLFSCYLRMYCAIRGSQAWNTNDLRIAKRMSVLVVTDFLCWTPIVVVSAASLFDYHLVSLEGLKVLTVFILPLNSVANPFLYAITTKKFKRDLAILKRRFVALLTSKWLHQRDQQHLPHYYHHHHHHQNQNHHHNHQIQQTPAKGVKNVKGNNVQAGLLTSAAAAAARKANDNLLSENNQLMVSIRKAQKQQQRQQRLKSTNVNSRKANNSRQVVAVSNFNQVTMNRTTTQCSCQMAAAKAEAAAGSKQVRAPMSAAKSIQVRLDGTSSLISSSAQAQQAAQQVGQPFVALLSPTDSSPSPVPSSGGASNASSLQTVHPKIVLDIIEPALDVALAPLGLTLAGHHLPSRADAHSKGHGPPPLLVSSPPSSLLSHQATSEPQRNRRQSLLCSPTDLSAGGHLSARTCAKTNHLSCQAILMRNPSAASKVCTQQQDDLQESALRSASACGFTRASQAATLEHQANKHRSDSSSGGHLSRSIQRLLFSPIARTWSSIQSSLQSINSSSRQTDTMVAANAADVDGDMKNRQSDDYNDTNKQQQQRPVSGNCIDDSPETTLEDILQLSSPARRSLLRNNSQRRMSRSCELIPGETSSSSSSAAAKRQSIISNSDATRSTSSQYDDQFDDDSRILLATINRMARSRRVAPNLVSGLARQTKAAGPAPPAKSRRCYRCRSWSPALLDKLEDCMYQLRSRVSNLGAAGSSNQATLEPARQMRPHERIESTASDLMDDEQEEEDDEDEEQGEDEEEHDEEEEEEDEDDEFNETSFPEWNNNHSTISAGGSANNQCRREQYRRQSRGRHLRQQSSTNSDTLSTRTAATILTNLSVSFGSNTNIPPKLAPPPPPLPQHQHQHQHQHQPPPRPSDQFQH